MFLNQQFLKVKFDCTISVHTYSGFMMQEDIGTVKLDFKELLNKEQIGFKELFTDYQLFYTVNLLLNKELLPIYEMPNLALKNLRS